MIREIKYEKLGKLAEFKNGINYRRGSAGSKVRIINVKELVSMGIIDDNVSLPTIELEEIKYRPYLLKENDIVIARSASPGEVVLFKGVKETIYSGFSIKISFGNNIYPEFLYYYLQFYKKRVINASNGTIFQNLNQKILSEIDFPMINFDLQVNVVRILSALDDKIEVNNKINSTLEELAQTLYKRWFVDFEFPNEEGKPYKSSGGEMVDSELGLIPKGWDYRRIDEIANVRIGRTPPRKEPIWFSNNSNDIKWYSIKDMGNSGVFMDASSEYLTNEAIENFNVPIIEPDRVLVSFKLTVGRVAITTDSCATNEAIAHFIPYGDNIKSSYLYLLLKNYNFDALGNTSSIATAVNSKSIKSIKVLVPNDEILGKFSIIVDNVFQKIKNGSFENSSLMKLRDLLLPKLMSGEIEV